MSRESQSEPANEESIITEVRIALFEPSQTQQVVVAKGAGITDLADFQKLDTLTALHESKEELFTLFGCGAYAFEVIHEEFVKAKRPHKKIQIVLFIDNVGVQLLEILPEFAVS